MSAVSYTLMTGPPGQVAEPGSRCRSVAERRDYTTAPGNPKSLHPREFPPRTRDYVLDRPPGRTYVCLRRRTRSSMPSATCAFRGCEVRRDRQLSELSDALPLA